MKPLSKHEIKKFFKEASRRGKDIRVVMENTQYAKNVAAVFRTVDAAGVKKLYLTGIAKTPPFGKELQQASRTKERTVKWEYYEKTTDIIEELRDEGFTIIAVEITDRSFELNNLKNIIKNKQKVCFIFGNEVYGVVKKTLAECDYSVHIPMYGKGASLNVSTTVGIVLYAF